MRPGWPGLLLAPLVALAAAVGMADGGSPSIEQGFGKAAGRATVLAFEPAAAPLNEVIVRFAADVDAADFAASRCLSVTSRFTSDPRTYYREHPIVDV